MNFKFIYYNQRDDIDWTQTRVIFVSSSFTENQKQATNFKDIGIELWEVKRYENGYLSIIPVKKTNNIESIKTLTGKSAFFEKISKEIKIHTEEQHLKGMPEKIKELYEDFKSSILSLDSSIEVHPCKLYIGF